MATIEFRKRNDSTGGWYRCYDPANRLPGSFNFKKMDIRINDIIFFENSPEFRKALEYAQVWMRLQG